MGVAAPVVAVVLMAAVVPWTAGLVHFAHALPDRVTDPDSRTDAIVVLTGGSDRVATGLRLLAENKADCVFISGVAPGVEVGQVMRLAGSPSRALEDRIEAGHGARDTEGNAEETAAWIHERGYRSLRLVTAAYHMPRSLLEFQALLPEVRVVPHPVFPEHVKQSVWWFRPGTAALIIGEYNKYLLTSIEHWALGGWASQQGTDRLRTGRGGDGQGPLRGNG